MTFSNIAIKLLKEKGYDIDFCSSEEEAIKKSSNGFEDKYPVYFSGSNTTGEKPYEEFYTKEENVSLDKYEALGVVINLKPRKTSEVNELFSCLNKAFENENTSKKEIVIIMKNFLNNFNHKELGKSLDSKM
jgi:FlaA1/EpsC-like NDP-sugar epimerase